MGTGRLFRERLRRRYHAGNKSRKTTG